MGKKIISTFPDRLKECLENNPSFTATSLADEVGLSKQAISMYISGDRNPKRPTIKVIAEVLNVDEAWLMGYDVPMQRVIQEKTHLPNFDNIRPVSLKKFPLLGEIACGKPIFADEDRESYVLAGSDIRADFCLKAKGDSMKNVRILDGDIVFIRRQDMVNNGEISAVIIDDEATLKRVFYYREKDLLILKAENAKFSDLIYSGSELEQIRILGKAVAFQSDVI